MPLLTTADGGYTYRGFRVLPCFTSRASWRPIKSQRGWESRDLDQGFTNVYRGPRWFSTLERFRREIDDIYRCAAEGRLTSERAGDLRDAIGRLDDPAEAQAALATLEAGLALATERQRAAREAQAARDAEHEARRRLHEAAPDLLAALKKAVRFGGLFPDLKVEAEAAIARATQGGLIMDILAHRIAWACAALSFVNACAMFWLGLAYVTVGTGLHPALAGVLVLVSGIGCWLAASEADRIAQEGDVE